jgi:hypothetical protein
MDAKKVRSANLKALEKQGFRVADNLPVFREIYCEGAILRPRDEILGRLLALKTLWLWVDIHPQAETTATVKKMCAAVNAMDHLTGEEKHVFTLSRKDSVDEYGDRIGWKNENCWPLAWLLGFQEIPNVTHGQLNDDLARRLMLQWLPNNADECRSFMKAAKLREAEEARKLGDLFYCAHNAIRSAQLGEETVPEDFDPLTDGGCIHERRHALTWAMSPGTDWNLTDLSPREESRINEF